MRIRRRSLKGINFSGADLTDANFQAKDLTGIDLGKIIGKPHLT